LVIDNQVRSLRKRQVIASYKVEPDRKEHREGTYWGIRSHVADYELADTLDCPPEKTMRLANVPTRLKRLDSTVQKQLVNWGFAICDTAMRKHVDPSIPAPEAFPYPEVGVG
jgi:NTE family protein